MSHNTLPIELRIGNGRCQTETISPFFPLETVCACVTVANNTGKSQTYRFIPHKSAFSSTLIHCESHFCETWSTVTLTQSYFELKIKEQIQSLKISFSQIV